MKETTKIIILLVILILIVGSIIICNQYDDIKDWMKNKDDVKTENVTTPVNNPIAENEDGSYTIDGGASGLSEDEIMNMITGSEPNVIIDTEQQ